MRQFQISYQDSNSFAHAVEAWRDWRDAQGAGDVLIHIFSDGADEADVTKAYKVLLSELEEYNPELLVKDRVLAVTKTDLIDEKKRAKIEKKLPADIPHVFISSVAQTGLNELKEELWKALTR